MVLAPLDGYNASTSMLFLTHYSLVFLLFWWSCFGGILVAQSPSTAPQDTLDSHARRKAGAFFIKNAINECV